LIFGINTFLNLLDHVIWDRRIPPKKIKTLAKKKKDFGLSEYFNSDV
jgi:hypothetical protein